MVRVVVESEPGREENKSLSAGKGWWQGPKVLANIY